MRNLLRIFLAAILLASFSASSQKTTRRGLKVQPIEQMDTATYAGVDTIFNPGELVGIYAYEKPLQSNKESFHVMNNSSEGIVEIVAEIAYRDYQGNELHKRKVELKCDIPAGTTRLITFPSWDVQKRFYYAEGPKPRKQAYPYTVVIEVLSIILSK